VIAIFAYFILVNLLNFGSRFSNITKRVKWNPRCYNSIRSEAKREQFSFLEVDNKIIVNISKYFLLEG
jgi:hypothetical protein